MWVLGLGVFPRRRGKLSQKNKEGWTAKGRWDAVVEERLLEKRIQNKQREERIQKREGGRNKMMIVKIDSNGKTRCRV